MWIDMNAIFVAPHGSSIAAFDVGQHLKRPIIVQGLSCRTVDISAYSRSKEVEDHALLGPHLVERLGARVVVRSRFRGAAVDAASDAGVAEVVASGQHVPASRRRIGHQPQRLTVSSALTASRGVSEVSVAEPLGHFLGGQFFDKIGPQRLVLPVRRNLRIEKNLSQVHLGES
jgi:hypothetical protein